MMKSAVRQQRHWLKKDDFDPFPLHLVSKTSPIKSTSNEQWMDLVESWNHGRVRTKWYSIPKIPTSTLYMILWHLSNMYSLYDVGGSRAWLQWYHFAYFWLTSMHDWSIAYSLVNMFRCLFWPVSGLVLSSMQLYVIHLSYNVVHN